MKNLFFAVLISFLVISPAVSLAQTPGEVPDADDLGINPSPITDVDGIVAVIGKVAKYIYTIFFIVAVIVIIFAAFTYLTAAGDPNKLVTARQMIVYAVVAMIVAFLAVGASLIVSNFLEGGGGSYGGGGGSYSPGLSPGEGEGFYGSYDGSDTGIEDGSGSYPTESYPTGIEI